MRKRLLHYSLLLSVTILFSRCSLFDKSEPIPSYIHIDKFAMTINPAGFSGLSETGDEGSLSSKITDCWVYIDDQLLGCFEMPVTFPALQAGIHHIKIRPGIKLNGIAATRAPYPLYKVWEQDIDLQAGKTITLSPVTSYLSTTHFVHMESFENAGTVFGTDTTASDTSMIITNNPAVAFEGKSGMMILANGRTLAQAVSATGYILPKASVPVFLEFNYRCDKELNVFLYGVETGIASPLLTMNPTSSWNKTYLLLTTPINSSLSTHFKVIMYMAAPATDSSAFLVDNLKIVY